jgi:hypothetical protein
MFYKKTYCKSSFKPEINLLQISTSHAFEEITNPVIYPNLLFAYKTVTCSRYHIKITMLETKQNEPHNIRSFFL